LWLVLVVLVLVGAGGTGSSWCSNSGA
jgi:hypothetical protein